MGYFDHIDDKIEKIQEVGDIEKWAGTSFWYSIGAVGVLIHAVVLSFIFGWNNIYTTIPYLISIAFSIVGLVYSFKSGKASKLVRGKNELNSMARAYNLLWMLLSMVCLALNMGFAIALLLGKI